MNQNDLFKKIRIDDYQGSVGISLSGIQIQELTDSFIDELIVKLQEYLSKSKTNIIILQSSGEGFNPYFLKVFNFLVSNLLKKTNLTLDNFYLVTGTQPIIQNYNLYLEHVKKYNFLPIDVQFENIWEWALARHINSHPSFFENLNNEIKLKPKKFLCLNNTPKLHRLYLIAKIIENNLLDKSFCSLLSIGGSIENRILNLRNEFSLYFPHRSSEIVDQLKNNLNLFPLYLDGDPNRMARLDILYDKHYIENSYFSVITETIFFDDGLKRRENEIEVYDSYVFSEKTFKAIQGKHPFILVGKSGSLQVLKDMGYKTFHPFIDESYDKISDNQKRLDVITEEIKRLCSLSDNEYIDWLVKITPIVKHNFEILKNKHFETYLLKISR
jgi:hypothetical protein